MVKAEQSSLVDSLTVAKLFSVDARRVQQLAADKIITAVKVKGANKYNLTQVAQQYIKYLSDRAYGREGKIKTADLEAERLKAEIGIKQAKEQIAKMQVKELQGKMFCVEDYIAISLDREYAVRNMLTALPGRLAVDVTNINDAAENSERIRKEVHEIMRELEHYKFDPKKCQERVFERLKWEPDDEKNDDDGG